MGNQGSKFGVRAIPETGEPASDDRPSPLCAEKEPESESPRGPFPTSPTVLVVTGEERVAGVIPTALEFRTWVDPAPPELEQSFTPDDSEERSNSEEARWSPETAEDDTIVDEDDEDDEEDDIEGEGKEKEAKRGLGSRLQAPISSPCSTINSIYRYI